MRRWLEKWLIPLALSIMFIYSIWALCEVNRIINDYETRVTDPEKVEANTVEIDEPKTHEFVEKIEPEAMIAIEPKPQNLGTFKLTAYCSCPKCCGAWADGITFTGTIATEGRTVAVDPAVIPLGSKVYINGKEYIAEDTGGAINGNRIDVFFDSHSDALNFGVQYTDISIN